MNDTVKDQIGNYELIELIGDGAQGKVFKARYVADVPGPVARDEVVAIKVLRVPPDDERAHQRFETQARILKRFEHPHIIRYRDFFTWHPGEWDEAQCLVMEYLEGETLASRLNTLRRGLPWPEVKAIFEQCFSGLIHAGREGIIHRDLKPSNIFLAKDGTMRIFDFDIARVEGDSQRSTVGWKGSFDYMARDFITEPDFHGDEVSDVFSLGTCICQALTGKLPFEPLGENAHIGYLNRWRNADRPPALSFNAGAFRVLANARTFFSRSLSPQRSQRYPSFAEMLADFRKINYRLVQHTGKETYELRELLGRGGFGEVFMAVRQSDGQPVAIKHLFAERQSSRFIKEAKMLQRYAHPFLVKYIDFIEVQGAARENQYFLILELLAGMPDACLRHRIRREGKFEPAEAIPLFMNYLEALSFLHGHSHPLIHRDIKPMNLYAPAGHPENAKVFDLGVARDVSGTVTSGGIPGTLDYMAPEFSRSGADRGTPQSDLYSLGLCLYEALAGQTAFACLPADINSAWVVFQSRTQNVPEVDYQARVFRLYPDLKAVVQQAIASRPGDRYPSAAAMRQDLEKVLFRLDQPEDVPPMEEPMTVAAGTPVEPDNAVPVLPMPGKTSVLGARQSAGEESTESVLPEMPDMDITGDADVVMARRSKWRIRALGVILILVAGSVAVTLWWFQGGDRMHPGQVPAPVPASSSPLAVAPDESDVVRAASKEMDQVARSVRIPVADTAYIENLASALMRVRRWGESYPELSGEAGWKVQELEQHGRDLPALFQSGLDMALAQKDSWKANELLAAWRTSRRHALLMGLTSEQAGAQEAAMEKTLGRYQLDATAAEIARLIPSQFTGDQDLEQAEQAAETLEMMEGRIWPGVPVAEKQAKIASLRAALTARMKAGLAAWRNEAVARYQKGQNGESWHMALASLPDNLPAAVALVKQDYQDALKAVDAARANWDRMTRKQRTVLKWIEMGSNTVDREVLADLPVEPERVVETAAAAARVRQGFNTLVLLDAEEHSRVFLAAVADCWKKALRCEGPLSDAIRDSVWIAIHDQMVVQGSILLKPRDMALGGVRTPEQQARVRYAYLRLLARIEDVTGRVAGCRESDPLRLQVSRYFQRPFFHRALLEDPSFADNIPWLAEEFRKAQNQP